MRQWAIHKELGFSSKCSPFRKVFSLGPVSNWKDMLGCCGSGMQILMVLHKTQLCLGSFSSTAEIVTLKMKKAAITISLLCYCDIHLIHLQRTDLCKEHCAYVRDQCAWPPQYLQQQIESGVCVTKSMGLKFIEQLRLLLCYCSAFTKEGKNVSGCFNNSHRIA